jgi:hypothetical protein
VELGAGREDSDGRAGEHWRNVFLRLSQGELPDRLHADLLCELPAARGASLGQWLGRAAVSAEVIADGVIVLARANRVFRLSDIATAIREWMEANSVDALLASSDDALFMIALSTSETGTVRQSGFLPAGRPVLG